VAQPFTAKKVKGLLAGTPSTRTRRSQIPSVAQPFTAKKVKGLLSGTFSTRARRSQIPSVAQPFLEKNSGQGFTGCG
jgi:hypothetical protein